MRKKLSQEKKRIKKIKKPDNAFIGYTFKRITASDKEKYKKDFDSSNAGSKK